GSIGSMSAWLPSRRSTEHQRGAFSIWRLGHSRLARRSGSGRKGTYLWKGIFFGVRAFGGIFRSVGHWATGSRSKEKPPGMAAQGGYRRARRGHSPSDKEEASRDR